MRSNIASKLTLRAKFKTFDVVEVCITSSETGEVQLVEIPVLLGTDFPKPVNKKEGQEATGAASTPEESKISDEKGDTEDDSDRDEDE